MEALDQFLHVLGREAGRMWWFTLLGIVIAALIKTFQWDRKVRAYVGKAGFWAIPIACLIGTLSPLCSCGILPVVIPMALSGVAIAPLIALLITSPVMDPTSFFLTWGALGPELAWWKFGGALFLGMVGGTITWFFERTGYFSGNIVRLSPVFNENGELASGYDIGCANGLILKTMTVTPRESRLRFFFDRLLDVGLFVCIWVGLALVLEALIHVFVPIQWVTALVGQKGPSSVLASTIMALPLPAHQIPIVPILAGLQAKGIAVGADIAFLMAGPVTSIPAAVALWAIFKPRVVVVFIVIGLTGSALLGFARMALN